MNSWLCLMLELSIRSKKDPNINQRLNKISDFCNAAEKSLSCSVINDMLGFFLHWKKKPRKCIQNVALNVALHSQPDLIHQHKKAQSFRHHHNVLSEHSEWWGCVAVSCLITGLLNRCYERNKRKWLSSGANNCCKGTWASSLRCLPIYRNEANVTLPCCRNLIIWSTDKSQSQVHRLIS